MVKKDFQLAVDISYSAAIMNSMNNAQNNNTAPLIENEESEGMTTQEFYNQMSQDEKNVLVELCVSLTMTYQEGCERLMKVRGITISESVLVYK